jgi:hypothetical protein
MTRHKSGDYAEFTFRATGPADWPALTVELHFKYSDEFRLALKEALPPGTRTWDAEGEAWRVHPDYVEQAAELACNFFKYVYVVGENGSVRELRRGSPVAVQEGLFG